MNPSSPPPPLSTSTPNSPSPSAASANSLSLPFQSSHPHIFSSHSPCDRIFVHPISSADHLSEFENNPSDLKRRSDLFFRISGKLKELACGFGLVVVVTNQVVDFVGSCEGVSGVRVGNLGCLYSVGRRVCPALGISWANCVNLRLFLSRNEEIVGEERGLVDVGGDDLVRRRTKRQIHVVFAPNLPNRLVSL